MDSIHFSRFTRPTGLVGRLIIPRAYLKHICTLHVEDSAFLCKKSPGLSLLLCDVPGLSSWYDTYFHAAMYSCKSI